MRLGKESERGFRRQTARNLSMMEAGGMVIPGHRREIEEAAVQNLKDKFRCQISWQKKTKSWVIGHDKFTVQILPRPLMGFDLFRLWPRSEIPKQLPRKNTDLL